MEVIPAIDLLGGRCVRLHQGDFGKVITYEHDPIELAHACADAGARRLHVVDLDGARSGTPVNIATIEALAALGRIEVQAGGGIRDLARLQSLLAAGAARAVIGSVAIEEPETAFIWLDAVGAGRVVLGFDVRLDDRQDPQLVTRGWTERTTLGLWPLVERYMARGARDFLCTDVARDGTLSGPNVTLYAECGRRYPEARFIASGGVGSLADLRALADTGVAAVVTGKALLDGKLTLKEIASFSPAA